MDDRARNAAMCHDCAIVMNRRTRTHKPYQGVKEKAASFSAMHDRNRVYHEQQRQARALSARDEMKARLCKRWAADLEWAYKVGAALTGSKTLKEAKRLRAVADKISPHIV